MQAMWNTTLQRLFGQANHTLPITTNPFFKMAPKSDSRRKVLGEKHVSNAE